METKLSLRSQKSLRGRLNFICERSAANSLRQLFVLECHVRDVQINRNLESEVDGSLVTGVSLEVRNNLPAAVCIVRVCSNRRLGYGSY